MTVNAILTDGQGNPLTTAYLHFQLWNCGANVPRTSLNAIVQQQFIICANPSTGLISGNIYGADQIFCGNINSTEWLVTQYKAGNQAGSVPQYYCLNTGDVFNPATTQPCQLPPLPPGFAPTFCQPN